jgi:hypothetical protein
MVAASGQWGLPDVWAGAGLPFSGQPGRADAPWTAEVATDALNVRDSASLDAAVIATLATGQRVMVTGGAIDGFVPVELAASGPAMQGWAAVAYLQPIDGSAWAKEPDHGAALDDGRAGTSGPETPEHDPAAVVAEPTVAPTLAPPTGAVDTPAPQPSGERWIDVDRTTATVTLYIGETPTAQFPALIGRDPSPDGYYSTAVGTFHVYSMDAALSSTPFVEDVYLTDWVGFDPVRKNGFHSPVRNADGSVRVTGGTVTMGCVRLGAEDAETLYAFAELGMRVEIHD